MRRIAVLVALLVPVSATTTEEVTVKCTVCGNEFQAEQWNTTNTAGGVDRDFLEHAAGGQVFILACWTCPRCCFTGFKDSFDPAKAPKELIERLRKENPLKPAEPIDPKTVRSDQIPPWVRYDLLIQVLRITPDATPEHLANTCLRTAQTQRFGWDTLDKDLCRRQDARRKAVWDAIPEEFRKWNPYDSDIAIARVLEAQAENPKGDADDRREAGVGAALLYKERGEDADAERVLKRLAVGKLTAEQRAAVAEIRVRIQRERKYQILALSYFEEHVAKGKPEGQEGIAMQYLIGVLYRRTGYPHKAIAELLPLLAKEGIPDDLLWWIKDELAKAKPG